MGSPYGIFLNQQVLVPQIPRQQKMLQQQCMGIYPSNSSFQSPRLLEYQNLKDNIGCLSHETINKYGNEESDEEMENSNRTLFCSNLDDRITEELLYEVFLQAGPIEKVRIPRDRMGCSRCFGFVTYVHRCTLRYALQLYHGLTLFRKVVHIKISDVKSTPIKRPLQLNCQEDIMRQRRNESDTYIYKAKNLSRCNTILDSSLNSTKEASRNILNKIKFLHKSRDNLNGRRYSEQKKMRNDNQDKRYRDHRENNKRRRK